MRRFRKSLATLLVLLVGAPANSLAQPIHEWLGRNCIECAALMSKKTGVYILEKGEEALGN